MDDLISRQAAIKALEREKVYMSGFQSDGTIIHPFDKYNRGLEDGIEALKVLPSAQQERKEGLWIWDDEGYHCSECFYHASGNTDAILSGEYRHCPYCGVKMKGEENA